MKKLVGKKHKWFDIVFVNKPNFIFWHSYNARAKKKEEEKDATVA